MSEAEDYDRLGPFDFESIYSDHYEEIRKKVWYYIPARENSKSWITEISFDRRGIVSELKRYRVRN